MDSLFKEVFEKAWKQLESNEPFWCDIFNRPVDSKFTNFLNENGFDVYCLYLMESYENVYAPISMSPDELRRIAIRRAELRESGVSDDDITKYIIICTKEKIMTIADEMGFDERTPEDSYFVVGSHQEGEEIEFDGVYDGDSVFLELNEERILVRDVHYDEEDDIYWGVIYGFEPSFGVEFEGLKISEEITFREDHVFSCIRV